MKKLGYTLAETLITLMVVGIVAALTIPSLVTANQNRVNAAALSVAVSDFENAMAAMMMADGVTDVFGTKAWMDLTKSGEDELYGYSTPEVVESFINDISKYLTLATYCKDAGTFYGDIRLKFMSGEVLNDEGDGVYLEPVVLVSKKGFSYSLYIGSSVADTFPYRKSEEEVFEAGGTMTSNAASVTIDVNGIKKPNTYGRDIFMFVLGGEGVLYPVGGKDYSIFYRGDDSLTWQKKCMETSTYYGQYCAGRVVENGYKIDY